MENITKQTQEVLSEVQSTQHVTSNEQGISILIPMDILQKSFQEHMNSILTDKSSYNNPIKKVVDDMIGTYGSTNKELKEEFKKLVEVQMRQYMTTPGFHLQLGQAMAEEMAKAAVDKLNKK